MALFFYYSPLDRWHIFWWSLKVLGSMNIEIYPCNHRKSILTGIQWTEDHFKLATKSCWRHWAGQNNHADRNCKANFSFSCTIWRPDLLLWHYDQYSRLTGFDALLIDRVVYYKFAVILWFLCTKKYLDAFSLKHVVFVQKWFKNLGEISR